MKVAHVLPFAVLFFVMSTSCQQERATGPVLEAGRASEVARESLAGDSDEWRWPAGPGSPKQPIGVPRLAEPFVIDGKLDEWSSGLAVPARAESLYIYMQGGHKWLGPDDASMECFVAWNDEGVCAAVAVADSDVVNNQPPETPWDQDCVAIVVETNSDEGLAYGDPKPPGVRLLFIPPRVDLPAGLYEPSETPSGVDYKVSRTGKGYVVEVLIPWSLLPDRGPECGEQLGVRFTMIDYDRRDGDQVVPFGMTWHPSWYRSMSRRPPGKTSPAVLVDRLTRSADTDLESEVMLDVDNCPPAEDTTVPIGIDLGINIGREARSVELIINNWRSERTLTQRLGLKSSGASWGVRKSAIYTWRLENVPCGEYTITARVLDSKGDSLGEVRREVLIVRGFTEGVLGRIEEADPGEIAVSQPFLATDWLAAAANLERFRQTASWKDVPGTGLQARELLARLALLESGVRPAYSDSLLDLLTLAVDPEAQVMVEFSQPQEAHVSLYWGAAPIATVSVQQYPDEESARREFGGVPSGGPIGAWWQTTEFAGLPAKIRLRDFACSAMTMESFDPGKHVLLWNGSDGRGIILALEDFMLAMPEEPAAVLLAEPVPAATRAILDGHLAEIAESLGEAAPGTVDQDGWVLILGDVAGSKIGSKVDQSGAVLYQPVAEVASVEILSGKRIIRSTSSSAEVAQGAALAVATGEPISLGQIDAFRVALAEQIEDAKVGPAPTTAETMLLYVGDMHMHTIYSDGSYSPIYMALQTFCSGMDFAVITDHNAVAGAQLATAYCARYGFGHSVIVGDEISTAWAHLNAYPLRELVDWELGPYDIVRSAHAQGAVVQWNHPTEGDGGEWTEVGFAYGVGPLGVDAWEHVPPDYEQWRAEGRLPALVGSTDEHMGYFFNLERSFILAPSASGPDVAEAVRRSNVCIFEPTMENVVYGAPHMIKLVRNALLEGSELRQRRADQIRAALAEADITGLINATGQRRMTQEQTDELLRALWEEQVGEKK